VSIPSEGYFGAKKEKEKDLTVGSSPPVTASVLPPDGELKKAGVFYGNFGPIFGCSDNLDIRLVLS
jgi:hypothetical protein